MDEDMTADDLLRLRAGAVRLPRHARPAGPTLVSKIPVGVQPAVLEGPVTKAVAT